MQQTDNYATDNYVCSICKENNECTNFFHESTNFNEGGCNIEFGSEFEFEFESKRIKEAIAEAMSTIAFSNKS